MMFLLLLGVCSRFQQVAAEPESVNLYESMPAFIWEDSCPNIVDACITDDMLLVIHKDASYTEYSTIRSYELSSGNMIWEIDSLKAEKYPVFVSIAEDQLFTCVHHPDSLTEPETELFDWYYRFERRAEDPGSSLYLLQCYGLNTGELLFQFVTGVLPAKAPPLVTDDRIVILCSDEVFCFNSEGGELLWKTVLNDPYPFVGRHHVVDSRPDRYSGNIILSEGTLYIGLRYPNHIDSSGDWKNMFALSIENGELLWRAFQEKGVFSGPDAHEEALYLYSYDTVCRRSIISGELVWERNYGDGFSTHLWQHPQLWTIHANGHPFIYWNGRMLVPHSGGGFGDSVDVLRLQDGTLESTLPVFQTQSGICLLEGESGEEFLLSTESIDRSYSPLTLRTLPELERLWMYYFRAIRFVAGEGFICALNRNSFMVFH